MTGRVAMVWAATAADGTPLAGLVHVSAPPSFQTVAAAAGRCGADMRRLVRARAATDDERVAYSASDAQDRAERRAIQNASLLWHVSGDHWGRVRSKQRHVT